MLSETDTSTDSKKPTRIAGVFKDYIRGLDCLRTDLSKKEESLNNILKIFYKLNEKDTSNEKYGDYLKSVSSSFDACNDVFVSNGVSRAIIVDGQAPIAKLINLVKSSPIDLDKNTLNIVIDFWENITYTMERFQILLDSLEKDIYSKLNVTYSSNPLSNMIDGISSTDDQVKIFVTDITRFSKSLPEKIMNCRFLIRSCGTHMRMALVNRSLVSDTILTDVSVSRYPLLKVIPDLEFKLNDMFRICKKWLNREETFILDISQQIRQRRLLVKEKETRIMSARDHQKKVIESLKNSFILCQNSKIKMKEIMKELKMLESQIHATSSHQQKLFEEKNETQSMAEFLSISISQTRRNYSLQMKKQRLEIQVGELETTLIQLDAEISMFKQEMVSKSNEKNKTKYILQTVEKTYTDAKSDLESYTQSLKSYQSDLIAIKQTLNAMERLQLLKSSPEYVENIFGDFQASRSQSVHLSPSLQDAINRRTQKNNSSM